MVRDNDARTIRKPALNVSRVEVDDANDAEPVVHGAEAPTDDLLEASRTRIRIARRKHAQQSQPGIAYGC